MPRSKRQKFIAKTEQTIYHLAVAMKNIEILLAYIKFSKWTKDVKKISKLCNKAIKILKKVYNEWC